MTKVVAAVVPSVCMLLAGCVSSERFDLPAGQQAYNIIPAQREEGPQPEYRINPFDQLTITVFREPDLGVTQAPVETGGGLVLPLIGRVQAVGRTTSELSRFIEERLGASGLRNPRVSVILAESGSQNVTVDGAVQQAGVYPLRGTTTLLQSIALARGATRTAELDRVVIFRTIDGQRSGALFDAQAIREGRAPDPNLRSGDYVIVGTSAIRAFYYDALTVLPAFGLFVPLVQAF